MPPTPRGRLAPSPTGLLHLGHARTFAIAHRRVRAAGGSLLLRMEDLDPQRSRPLYPNTCRPAHPLTHLPTHPAGHNWRFRVPDGETVSFHDDTLGPVSFTAGLHFGDFLLWRRDNVPAYQLACTVDDARQRVSDVTRGADLLLSTARQLLLYRALGLTPPSTWCHLPLLNGPDGQRLSKRSDSQSIRNLREQGLTPAEVFSLAGL